jgi:hypothetical protein
VKTKEPTTTTTTSSSSGSSTAINHGTGGGLRNGASPGLVGEGVGGGGFTVWLNQRQEVSRGELAGVGVAGAAVGGTVAWLVMQGIAGAWKGRS